MKEDHMSRNRASAKAAGSRLERIAADYLGEQSGTDHVDRQVKVGAFDTGDVRGVKAHGKRLVIECKDYGGRLEAGPWVKEAEVERGNADALAAFVVAKRRGTTDPGDQFVILTLRDMAAILYGVRDPE